MKKISVVLLALVALVAPYAEAKTCYGTSCNYIDTNAGFQNPNPGDNWSKDPGVTFPSATWCLNTSVVASLDNTEAIWRFPFVDDSYSDFKLRFRAYLVDDTDNFYDELKITVKNRDTGISETMTLHGSSFDNCEQDFINFELDNDYSYSDVTVTFESGTFSSHAWQIDDVSFFAYY